VHACNSFKYWSCCDGKKTLDFEEFLNLPGCKTEERCLWFDEEVKGEVDKPVRFVAHTTSFTHT
jgi:hypothetical protein